MKKLRIFLLGFSLLISGFSFALTWDEPWAEMVIKESESFVFGQIIESSDSLVKVRVIRHIGGKPVSDVITLTGFYSLRICSSSGGHGPEFHLDGADSLYLFVKQLSSGEYGIATPTSGFDIVMDGKVMSTYRHSYHQAMVPISVYEVTMTAIFNHYHQIKHNQDELKKFIFSTLEKKPAGFGESEIELFFQQHAALETAYHLGIEVDEKMLVAFITDSSNFHNQVSGLRALRASKSKLAIDAAFQIIEDSDSRDFLKVIALLSLSEMKSGEINKRLRALKINPSEESDGFGGNIMDPRVCTHFPSVSEALEAVGE